MYLTDILLVGLPGSSLLTSQMLPAGIRGEKFLVYLDTAPSKIQGLLARCRENAKISTGYMNLDV